MTTRKRKSNKLTVEQLLNGDDIKQLLRDVVDDNNKNQIETIAVVYMGPDGRLTYDASGDSVLKIIGLLEWAKLDLMTEHEEGETA